MNDSKPESILSYVRRMLALHLGQHQTISKVTGVPYFTIAKIHQGRSLNPGLDSIQPLIDYFRDCPGGEPAPLMTGQQPARGPAANDPSKPTPRRWKARAV